MASASLALHPFQGSFVGLTCPARIQGARSSLLLPQLRLEPVRPLLPLLIRALLLLAVQFSAVTVARFGKPRGAVLTGWCRRGRMSSVKRNAGGFVGSHRQTSEGGRSCGSVT